MFAFVLFNS